MAKYMLLEVALHGLDTPHDEVIKRVEFALDKEFPYRYFSVEVECIEHAGEDAELG